MTTKEEQRIEDFCQRRIKELESQIVDVDESRKWDVQKSLDINCNNSRIAKMETFEEVIWEINHRSE